MGRRNFYRYNLSRKLPNYSHEESQGKPARKDAGRKRDLFSLRKRGGVKTVTGRNRENLNQNYINYVNSFDPPTQHFKTCGRAFMVGGFICCIGQFFRYMLEFAGLTGDILAGTVSVILIFLGTLLTGFGVYDRIGKNAGAGSIVPITGFANSVASPAIEFKTEGFVYGMAAKMFIVAGPIIVFGVSAGAAVGLVYWLLGL